jgi:hypothetical protein
MEVWVEVTPKTEGAKHWLKESYEKASKYFKERHPEFQSQNPRYMIHGITPYFQPIYHWEISCHRSHEGHAMQTQQDITAVLTQMQAPEGILIQLNIV